MSDPQPVEYPLVFKNEKVALDESVFLCNTALYENFTRKKTQMNKFDVHYPFKGGRVLQVEAATEEDARSDFEQKYPHIKITKIEAVKESYPSFETKINNGIFSELSGQGWHSVEGTGQQEKFANSGKQKDPGPLPEELKSLISPFFLRTWLQIGVAEGTLEGCREEHERIGCPLPQDADSYIPGSRGGVGEPLQGWQGRASFSLGVDMKALEQWAVSGVSEYKNKTIVVDNSRAYLRLREAGFPLAHYSKRYKVEIQEEIDGNNNQAAH